MSAAITVVIAHTLPRHNRSQALGLPSSNTPLRASIIADPKQANLSRRPWLLSTPLDDIKEALARSSRHCVEETRRHSKAALVGAHNNVVMLCPEPRVWRLPRRVFRAVLWIDL